MNMQKQVVIIGGGLGGLFTAALLGKEGYRVTVLERGAQVGGGLQSFRRNGVSFDAGMHVLGGFQPGGSLDRIFRYLGIQDQVRIRPVDADCMDEVYCHEDQRVYRVPGEWRLLPPISSTSFRRSTIISSGIWRQWTASPTKWDFFICALAVSNMWGLTRSSTNLPRSLSRPIFMTRSCGIC